MNDCVVIQPIRHPARAVSKFPALGGRLATWLQSLGASDSGPRSSPSLAVGASAAAVYRAMAMPGMWRRGTWVSGTSFADLNRLRFPPHFSALCIRRTA